jgi:hypothetical protein
MLKKIKLKLIPTTQKAKNVKENILAFRTITTILSKIQQSVISEDHTKSKVQKELQELLVLNALATVIVMNREVVAVVASRRPEDGEFGVLACQQLDDNEASSTPSGRFRFLVNKNPRKDTVVSNTFPVLSDPKNPKISLDESDLEARHQKLIEYFHARWWVLHYNIAAIHADIICNRSGETFESHVWNLINLFVLPNPEEVERELLNYVISTCFAKIYHRLNHKSVSLPYLTSLRQVQTVEFKELPPDMRITESQRKNDELLFTLFPFLEFSAELPGLAGQATRAARNEPHALYTKETSWEFHLLLIKLLDSFHQALAGLDKSRGTPVKPEAGSPEFLRHLSKAVSSGYALQRIVRGSGISHHLYNLTLSLDYHRRPEHANSTMAKGKGKATDLTMTDGECTEDQDMDLLEIRPGVIKDGQPRPLWKSYLDWLKLILNHFNAVEILVRFITGPYFQTKAISIKILTSPNVGGLKLPWREVLNNPMRFPESGEGVSNEAIFKFLSDGITGIFNLKSPDVPVKDVNNFLNIFQQFTTSEAPLVLFEDLKSSGLYLNKHKGPTHWKEYIDQINSNVANLQHYPNDSESIFRINEAVHLLLDNAAIFRLFRDVDSLAFTGSLHCEATLASLFMLPPPSSDTDLSPRIEVIYIAFILFAVIY